MMASLPVYWLPDPVQEVPELVRLSGPDGRHAATVRRTRIGEQVELVDGTGLRLRCEVVAVAPAALETRVLSAHREPDPAPRLVVVQALAKGDRSELAVATATEVGADVIVPWSASRSVVQWRGERTARSLARWRSTVREAAKQSRRSRAPEVVGLACTTDVAGRLADAALAVVLHQSATVPLSSLQVPAAGDVVVVVGPEGGIGDEELAAFGVEPVRLGPTVLRTSTAGVAACAALLSRTPRWA